MDSLSEIVVRIDHTIKFYNMAFQKGIMKLEGRIDDITFYQSWYGYAARKKTGVSGQRLKTDPVFVRAQENMSEFGRSGKATKLIRTAFKMPILEVADVRFTQRLVQTTMRIIKSDNINDRGKRIFNNGDLSQLLALEFNAAATFTHAFSAPFSSTIDRAAGSLTVEVASFVPAGHIRKPAGATHFRLVASAGELDFNSEERVTHTMSSPHLTIGSQKETINLTCRLSPGSTKTLLLALGIQFWQETNASQYQIQDKAHNAMKFIHVDGYRAMGN